MLSRVQLFVTPWTVTLQAPLSMGFSRQQYWSGLPFPTPGGLPDSGTEPTSPVSSALASGLFTTAPPRKPLKGVCVCVCDFYFEYTHTPMYMGFPHGSVIKKLPANAGDTVRSLGQEDPVEKEMVTHSSILAWTIYGRRSLVGYSPLGRKKVERD